jgi:hypothetical protein
MRVFSRIALTLLVAIIVCCSSTLIAAQFQADCPLQLVASTPAPTGCCPFFLSPHGAFKFGNLVFVLRGQLLTTYSTNASTNSGDIQNTPPRQDLLGNLSGREAAGGSAFSNGFLYLSSDAGLEIFDLTNTRPGGSAPVLKSRTPNLHYRRLAVSNNVLAGVFPATDFPCFIGGPTPGCFNSIDLFDVSNPSAPALVASILSTSSPVGGFNDVAFNFGFLVATGLNGTGVYNVFSPSTPAFVAGVSTPGTFLVSNGANLVGIGNDTSVLTETVNAFNGGLSPLALHTLARLRGEHSNPLMFHRQAAFDDSGTRLITMVDEMDPQTLLPARTFAFDVFNYNIVMFEGQDPRQYEQVSYTQGDEIKYNPVATGPFVYVVGEVSGVQEYGVCGQMSGRIEFSLASLPCPAATGGPTNATVHGWVTGANKIANVELFLDGSSLGSAPTTDNSNPPRTDVPSTTPVQSWSIGIALPSNLGGPAGMGNPGQVHYLTAVGTDVNGNRSQFASQVVFFVPNWQSNCLARRRSVNR